MNTAKEMLCYVMSTPIPSTSPPSSHLLASPRLLNYFPFHLFPQISSPLLFSLHVYSLLLSSPVLTSPHISSNLISCHVMSSDVMSCHLISYHVMSSHIMSCHLISYHVMSSPHVSSPLSFPLSCLLLSSPFLSSKLFSPILSYPLLSSPLLSSPLFFFSCLLIFSLTYGVPETQTMDPQLMSSACQRLQ